MERSYIFRRSRYIRLGLGEKHGTGLTHLSLRPRLWVSCLSVDLQVAGEKPRPKPKGASRSARNGPKLSHVRAGANPFRSLPRPHEARHSEEGWNSALCVNFWDYQTYGGIREMVRTATSKEWLLLLWRERGTHCLF